jgi:hypothetical protein
MDLLKYTNIEQYYIYYDLTNKPTSRPIRLFVYYLMGLLLVGLSGSKQTIFINMFVYRTPCPYQRSWALFSCRSYFQTIHRLETSAYTHMCTSLSSLSPNSLPTTLSCQARYYPPTTSRRQSTQRSHTKRLLHSTSIAPRVWITSRAMYREWGGGRGKMEGIGQDLITPATPLEELVPSSYRSRFAGRR